MPVSKASLFAAVTFASLITPLHVLGQIVQRDYVTAQRHGVNQTTVREAQARAEGGPMLRAGPTRGALGILWTYDDIVHPAPVPESVALSTITGSAWVGQDLNSQRLQRFLIHGDGTPAMEIPGVAGSDVAVAAAKDADLAVWVSETDTVTITAYNSLSTTPLWDVPIPLPYTNINVHSTRVSRDGAIVCCAVRDDGPPEATRLFILDGATGAELEVWDYPDRVDGIDLTDDGSLCLVKQGTNGRLIDTATAAEVFTGTVTGVGGGWSISGDGEVFALGGFTEMVVYKKSGPIYTPVIVFPSAEESFEEVAVSADGSTVGAMAVNFMNFLDTTTYIFDMASESLIGQYETFGTGVHQDFPSAAAVSDDGSVIALGSWGTQGNDHPEVMVLDRCANLIGSIDSAGSIMSLDLSADGAYVLAGSKSVHANVTGSGGTVTMYQLREPGTPRVIYVDADSPGGDGASWDTAYNDLQDALDAACFDAQVWVAAGTYMPSKRTDPNDSRSVTFQLADGVALFGGFAGGEESLDDRNIDPETNGTVLGGDVNVPGDDSDNAYTVVTGSDTDETAVLDGFTVTGGRADGEGLLTPAATGGGLYIWTGSPTLRNCLITENMALRGGGAINIDESNPTYTNCTFRGNVVADGELAPGAFAAGMANLGNSRVTVTDCSFVDNSAPNASTGGLYVSSGGSDTLIQNCLFQGNSAWRGGALVVDGGASPLIDNCRFLDNTADTSVPEPPYPALAGAVLLVGGSPELRDCTFAGNTTSGLGGGLVVALTDDVALSNCTFSMNSAGDLGGGVYAVQSATLTVANGVFWGNTDTAGANTDETAQVYDDPIYGANDVSVTYSCVQDDDAGDGYVYPGVGNIDDDPQLDDLRLMTASPCINTGDPDFAAEPGETDLDGHSRVLCGRVDMGAYEFGIGDYDCNQGVDLADFAALQRCFTSSDAGPYELGCEALDFDYDGDVDLDDYAGFQRVFAGE